MHYQQNNENIIMNNERKKGATSFHYIENRM
jgi:hypothetical protein